MSLHLSAATAIGTASARGSFALDHARVEHATVFDGSSIATSSAASEIHLASGTRLLLAAGSQGLVFRDHLLLDNGQAQLDTSSAYGIETAGLRIEASEQASSGRIARIGETIQVESLSGAFMIRDLQGRVLADVKAGDHLRLTPGASNASAVSLTGKVRQVDGKYLLTDETAKSTVELRGAPVQSMVGKRVTVHGSTIAGTPAAGAAEIVEIASLHIAAGVSTAAIVAGVAITSGGGVALGVGLTRDDSKPAASR